VKRWSHGHSIGTGVVGGLLVARHVFLIFGAGLVVGVALSWLAGLVGELRRRISRA
jgi:hypothetical protein